MLSVLFIIFSLSIEKLIQFGSFFYTFICIFKKIIDVSDFYIFKEQNNKHSYSLILLFCYLFRRLKNVLNSNFILSVYDESKRKFALIFSWQFFSPSSNEFYYKN